MRILMVCTDAEIGGAERFLVSLAQAKQPGDSVYLAVLMQPGTLSNQLELAFDKVHYLNFTVKSRNIFGMTRALKRVISIAKPDIISSHLFHADLVTALVNVKIPKTTTVHTQELTQSDHPLTRLIAKLVGLLSFRFSAVIPAGSSEQMFAFIQKLGMKHIVSPIPNCANVPVQYKYNSHSRTLLSLARNHPVKGHLQLFQAFTRVAQILPNWILLAHGPGVNPSDERMQIAIDQAGARTLLEQGRIVLGGPLTEPETVLSDASALIISSLYGEAFPIVGVEAAGLGIPVITTDLGSCAEFADNKRFVVPPNDVEALAEAMQAFMNLSDGERISLSKTARERAEGEYHPRVAYERYRQVFTNVIEKRFR